MLVCLEATQLYTQSVFYCPPSNNEIMIIINIANEQKNDQHDCITYFEYMEKNYTVCLNADTIDTILVSQGVNK